MAYITGQTEQGCCLPVKYSGNNTYECEPDVGELHKKHKIYNDYHMFYAKIVGQKGERVNINIKWPQYDPALVSEEYQKWASYSADWPSFFPTVKETLYLSEDEINWGNIVNAEQEGDTIKVSFVMTSNVMYISSTLHYTPANYRNLIDTVETTDKIQVLSLGKAYDGSEFLTFVATDFSVPATDKKTVYIQAAQHCHEHTGCHICDYMLRFLASGKADDILKKYIFRITPVVDVFGWKLGKQTNPNRCDSLGFNYNRDWKDFTLPEVKAIDEYIKKCMADGEKFCFVADMHGGTGNEDDYKSGASVTMDKNASDEVIEKQKIFVDMVREKCDFLNPEDEGYIICDDGDNLFEHYAQVNYGPTFTFEISMSKIWDREAKRRFPNSQASYKRFAEQLTRVIPEWIEKE